MLRRSAERTMQAMIVSVFRRLQEIPTPSDSEERAAEAIISATVLSEGVRTPTAAEDPQLRMNAPDPMSGLIPSASTQPPHLGRNASYISTDGSTLNESSSPSSPLIPQEDGTESPQEPKSYGLPALREILRVLISLLNPHDQQHTDSMRLMALGLLNVAFEVGGKSIGRFPLLRAMVADELCKYLFQVSYAFTKGKSYSKCMAIL